MFSIFIVDDREIFRRRFKRFSVFQNSEQFRVEFEAQNGVEALEILRKEKVDIMITDIRMPIMGGLELLRQAKEENLCPCIVLLSEYSDFSYAKQGIILGAFDYIVKPIEEEELKSLLERCSSYLKNLSRGSKKGSNGFRILPELILKNDQYADTISRQIVEKIVESEKDNTDKIWEELMDILKELSRIVTEKRPYIEMYCCFEELFSLEKSFDETEIIKNFVDKVKNIRKEINKFTVNSKNELVQAVCNTIVRNIEDNLSLQNIANLHFVNKAYLSHLFKQEMGMSFVDYLTMVKIERAKILLEYSKMKIYEISAKLGYSDTEYFSRTFRLAVGMTPSEFRQKMKKE